MIYSLLSLNRSFLFVMKSKIIFRDFLYIWLRFLPSSVLSRYQLLEKRVWLTTAFESRFQSNLLFLLSATRQRIEFKQSILLNLVSIKFVALRSQSTLQSRKSLFLQICFVVRAFYSAYQALNIYNDVRFWITRRFIKRTTNHYHKQKARKSEERISDAKNINLKKT
jgi:hypothetical protein